MKNDFLIKHATTKKKKSKSLSNVIFHSINEEHLVHSNEIKKFMEKKNASLKMIRTTLQVKPDSKIERRKKMFS